MIKSPTNLGNVSEKEICGTEYPRDCSVASLAIFWSLSPFWWFRTLITDLWLGRKIIFWIQISVSFWTINSAFSRLFGIAMIIDETLWWNSEYSNFVFSVISACRVLSFRSNIFTWYLVIESCLFWIENLSQIFILRTFLIWFMISRSDRIIFSHLISKSDMNNCMILAMNDKNLNLNIKKESELASEWKLVN